MEKQIQKEVELQQQYYAHQAGQYESAQMEGHEEHNFALSFLSSAIEFLKIQSVLDVGSGTGRVLRYLKGRCPNIHRIGIEPVQELREEGYAHGLSKSELRKGDGTQLEFKNQEFDLVCAFGVLHHVPNPNVVVSEMLRVARKAIFISDSNNFGQGSACGRFLKQLIDTVGLWRACNFFKTHGKGYLFEGGDGISYSYSVFNNYEQIKRQCSSIHLLNTKDGKADFYKTAGHVALLGIKS